ncbi:MAG: biotin carboxylase N-terminal domain-containing protein, partial [Anaerolineae bacterium]
MTRRRSIETVMVASRGEIARRIFRACREMGIKSAAVYSDVDAGSVWSRKADLSVPLSGVLPGDTYLNIDALLRAAHQVGADAIHPGYGFVAENPDFATACADAGITLIGPSPEAMRLMGSKVDARALATSVGVPVVPGYDRDDVRRGPTSGSAARPAEEAHGAGQAQVGAAAGAERDAGDLHLADEAERIGYPIMVKASAGGGGRGMRVVRAPGELQSALDAARAEALSAFGDDAVFLERYFEDARHVEVQVLGDGSGNLVHLFERECSVQRRHQKIIE